MTDEKYMNSKQGLDFIENICNATSKNILSEKIHEKDLFYELVVLDKNAWEKRRLNN